MESMAQMQGHYTAALKLGRACSGHFRALSKLEIARPCPDDLRTFGGLLQASSYYFAVLQFSDSES